VPELHLLRVFCGEDGAAGNPLAVFLDGAQVPPEACQRVAADLGLSETVFVLDGARGEVRIFTPAVELEFAGHPAVGTAWLLRQRGAAVDVLRPPAGEVAVRYDGSDSFVTAHADWGPPWDFERLDSADAVEALGGPPPGHDLVGAWAWLDEGAGSVRLRVFGPRIGVAEDEATGSAAVRLCVELSRPLTIRQGRGSLIHARPAGDAFAEVGGRSVLDETRDYALS
jgi:predicted PhzF superfamily epimerase YddE/YHI9